MLVVNSILPILSVLGYWAIILSSFGGSCRGVCADHTIHSHFFGHVPSRKVKPAPRGDLQRRHGLMIRGPVHEGLPKPPKEPKILAQYPEMKSIGSIGFIILAMFGGPGSPHTPNLMMSPSCSHRPLGTCHYGCRANDRRSATDPVAAYSTNAVSTGLCRS